MAIFFTTNMSAWEIDEPSRSFFTTFTFHLLEGLSAEESQAMFESLVFSSNSKLSTGERTRILDSEIVPKILRMCANIPCVIKTVAFLLSTKSTLDEWTHFVDVVWLSIKAPLTMITSTFNLVAFQRLPFLMKRCLLYCSLFPKDYEFDRFDLNIWLAREVKVEGSETVDVELIGDEYLQTLHEIGYLVEHGKNEDDLLTYKMPDFNYEFVKFIAKSDYSEYQSVGVETFHVDPTTIRHVSLIVDDASWYPPPWLYEAKKLLSILFLGKHCKVLASVEDIIPCLKYLQILSGHVEISECLLSNIGNLELLRSLRFILQNPKLLGEIIPRMQNLRILDIRRLENNVYVLPKEFHKLQCLRHLLVRFKLNDQVTPNSGELMSLTKFNLLVTGRDNELDTLVDRCYIAENQEIDYEERTEALRDDKFSNIALCWESPSHGDDDIVVKALQAPTSLKNMTIRCWKGLTVPRFLGLVSLQIMDCHECQLLPSFISTLPELKSFKLWNLDALEYIESVDYHEDEPYFKSLESLVLGNLPKVKAWKEYDKFKNKLIRQLTKLQISNSKLESLPLLMGKIVSLEVKDISVELLNSLIDWTNTSGPIVMAFRETTPMLKTLSISVVHELETIRIAVPVFESLIIRQCHQLLDLSVDTDSTFPLHFYYFPHPNLLFLAPN